MRWFEFHLAEVNWLKYNIPVMTYILFNCRSTFKRKRKAPWQHFLHFHAYLSSVRVNCDASTRCRIQPISSLPGCLAKFTSLLLLFPSFMAFVFSTPLTSIVGFLCNHLVVNTPKSLFIILQSSSTRREKVQCHHSSLGAINPWIHPEYEVR